MLNNRRSEIDVIVDILSLAKSSATKTRILYRANLNHSLCKNYLRLLLKKGLMEEQNNSELHANISLGGNRGKMYKTTEKGLELLSHVQKLNLFFESSIDATKSPILTSKEDEEKQMEGDPVQRLKDTIAKVREKEEELSHLKRELQAIENLLKEKLLISI